MSTPRHATPGRFIYSLSSKSRDWKAEEWLRSMKLPPPSGRVWQAPFGKPLAHMLYLLLAPQVAAYVCFCSQRKNFIRVFSIRAGMAEPFSKQGPCSFQGRGRERERETARESLREREKESARHDLSLFGSRHVANVSRGMWEILWMEAVSRIIRSYIYFPKNMFLLEAHTACMWKKTCRLKCFSYSQKVP